MGGIKKLMKRNIVASHTYNIKHMGAGGNEMSNV